MSLNIHFSPGFTSVADILTQIRRKERFLPENAPDSPVILHIPHSSRRLAKGGYVVSDDKLDSLLDLLTDHATDELFQLENAKRIVFETSRLSVDPERFWDNKAEPMAKIGMGALYECCPDGAPLRDLNSVSAWGKKLLRNYYQRHHQELEDSVALCLEIFDCCLIVDCHSYPLEPLPYEDPELRRPEICLGSDDFHTPQDLLCEAQRFFEGQGWEVGVNEPFSGSMVPISHYQKDSRVWSLMVEVRRDLYWNQALMAPNQSFERVREAIGRWLTSKHDSLRGERHRKKVAKTSNPG